MRRIINRWANKDHQPDNYVFSVLEQGQSAISQYELKENFIAFINNNNNMATVCKTATLNKSATIMEARHSASTIMKNAGDSPHFVKEMLGHRSLKTTENYPYAQHLNSFKLLSQESI